LLTSSESDRRRIRPVRLCDIDLDRRLRAAREVSQEERDDQAKLELLHAALFPSDTVYWVAA
jgi:hypothetical protein